MTREEAIQICKEVRHCLWIADEQKTTTIWDKGAVSEAMLMAIEALKQVTGKLKKPDDSLFTADSEVCKEQKSKLDLISRQAAIDALGEEPPVWCDEDYEIAERNQWRADIEAIESVPSADRPHGEWVQLFDNTWECTNCEQCEQFGEVIESTSDFCPNCGADMRGEDE